MQQAKHAHTNEWTLVPGVGHTSAGVVLSQNRPIYKSTSEVSLVLPTWADGSMRQRHKHFVADEPHLEDVLNVNM